MAIGPSAAATELLGLKPSRVRRLPGSGNEHWLVTTDTGRFVVRRFARTHDWASVVWEQELIRELASRGWPVAESVEGPADLDGRLWMVMRRLPGRPMATTTATSVLRGRLLARLHRDLADIEVPQRPGRALGHEVATELPDLLEDLPQVLAERVPDRALELSARMVEFTHRTLERLAQTDLDGLAVSAVHGDRMPWNILVYQGEVSGVLDFEKAHVELQATDVAFATWGGRYEAEVLAGYSAEAGPPAWSPNLLPLLWSATCLYALQRHLVLRRQGVAAGGLGWSIEHALRRWGA
jgi:Ser/Thr protein kinase RdoA (MazF antagonist)